MAIDFPSGPTLGQEFVAAGITYVWNGQGWAIKPFSGEGGGAVDAYTKAESHWFFVDVAGDTMTEGLTIASTTHSYIRIQAPPDLPANIFGQKGVTNRWAVQVGNGSAELGGNSGNDFVVAAYADNGTTVLGAAIRARRSDLSVDVGGPLKVNNDLRVQRTAAAPNDGLIFFGGGSATYLYETGGNFYFTGEVYAATDKKVWHAGNFNPANYLPLTGGTISGNLQTTADFYCRSISASGAITAAGNIQALNVTATGTLFSGGGLNVTGTSYVTGSLQLLGAGGHLGVSGNASIAAQLDVAGRSTANSFQSNAGGTQGIIYFADPGYAHYLHFDGTQYIMPGAVTNLANLYINSIANRWGADGNLIVSANGFKPGGLYWADSSDARIKTVRGDYTQGLDAIKALRPVRYTFKGNDVIYDAGSEEAVRIAKSKRDNPPPKDSELPVHSMDVKSSHAEVAAEGREFVGLIAQEAKVPMPEMVTLVPGEIDGTPVSDIHILDASALTFALINACKELAARVEALEAKG